MVVSILCSRFQQVFPRAPTESGFLKVVILVGERDSRFKEGAGDPRRSRLEYASYFLGADTSADLQIETSSTRLARASRMRILVLKYNA